MGWRQIKSPISLYEMFEFFVISTPSIHADYKLKAKPTIPTHKAGKAPYCCCHKSPRCRPPCYGDSSAARAGEEQRQTNAQARLLFPVREHHKLGESDRSIEIYIYLKTSQKATSAPEASK
jgi:hypothetical protein